MSNQDLAVSTEDANRDTNNENTQGLDDTKDPDISMADPSAQSAKIVSLLLNGAMVFITLEDAMLLPYFKTLMAKRWVPDTDNFIDGADNICNGDILRKLIHCCKYGEIPTDLQPLPSLWDSLMHADWLDNWFYDLFDTAEHIAPKAICYYHNYDDTFGKCQMPDDDWMQFHDI